MTKKQKIQILLNRLQSLPTRSLRVAAGFDACLDTVIRPVRSIGEDENPVFFSSIGEFGRYLARHQDLSCAIDVRTVSHRPGGNMPNLAAGLTALEIPVDCVGPLGMPVPDRAFSGIGRSLITVGSPGVCTALQFDDGKVMLSNMEGASGLNYAYLQQALGTKKIRELFQNCHLAAFVNWAELPQATDLWRGIAQDCWFSREPDLSRFLLVDLTDCRRRSEPEILEVLSLLRECSRYRRLALVLNQNEANQLAAVFKLTPSGLPELANQLREAVSAWLVVIHRNESCVLSQAGESFYSDGFLVPQPVISVGAGDTFHAALAFGLLHQFTLQELAFFSSLYAALYVEHGKAFTIPEMIKSMETFLSQ